MKKIKEFSRSYIFLSILYIAIGIVLLIGPNLSIEMIGNGLGVIMIVVGATYGVVYFTSGKRQEGFLQMDLVIAIVCVSFGVFVLLTPDFLSMVLPFAMATVLLLGAIVKIQSTVSMKRLFIRRWYLGLISALIIIALGIILLVFPFDTEARMLLYIGICLILDGMTNLLGLFCIQFRTKKLARMQKNNPGVDVKALIEKEWEEADAARAEKKARKKQKKNTEVVSDAVEVSTDEQRETCAEAVVPAADTAVYQADAARGTADGHKPLDVSEPTLSAFADAPSESKEDKEDKETLPDQSPVPACVCDTEDAARPADDQARSDEESEEPS